MHDNIITKSELPELTGQDVETLSRTSQKHDGESNLRCQVNLL